MTEPETITVYRFSAPAGVPTPRGLIPCVAADGDEFYVSESDYAWLVEQGIAKPIEYRTYVITSVEGESGK